MGRPTGGPTNVVLVLADDLGFSDLGCYGGEIDTPNLDRLGGSGVRMSAFYNIARCSPSRASLLTGRHPHETGVGILNADQRPWGYPGSLDVRVPTVAEEFQGSGYATCLSGKWHLSSDTSAPNEIWPTRRGFDEFYGILGGADDYFHPRGLYVGEERQAPPAEGYYFTDAVGEHAADFVARQAEAAQPRRGVRRADPRPMSSRDPGLQPERTALAWRRTGLSAAVAVALLLRTGLSRGSPLDIAAGAGALAVLVLAWLVGRRPGERGAPRRVLFVTATAVFAAGSLVVLQLLWTVK